MEIDANKEIRRAVDTGKVLFGLKQAQKNVLKGNGKLIIISRNIPVADKEKLKHFGNVSQIPFFEFKGSGITLGSVCGKPFIVGCCLVQDVGKSRVLELLGIAKAVKKTAKRPSAKKAVKKPATKTAKKAAKKKPVKSE